jgi:DMSO/TMAO reductase YedYZ molybdopterin-dependent catalytic subunit
MLQTRDRSLLPTNFRRAHTMRSYCEGVSTVIVPPSAPGQNRQAPAGQPLSERTLLWLAAACGVLGAIVTLAAAEVVAFFVAASSSPLFAVGAWIVDLAPPGFKEWIIRTFGTSDKLVLFICLGILLLVLSAIVGLLEYRKPPLGSITLAVIGAIAALAVVTRPDASPFWVAPTIIGVIAGVIMLRGAVVRMRGWQQAEALERRVPSAEPEIARRSFLRYVGAGAGVALIVGIGARAMNAGSAAVTAVRNAVKLPRPAKPAGPLPAGASLDVPGLSSYVTPADEFYRIDTALQVPALNPDDWKLHIGGMVDNEVDITFAELLALPLTEHMLTLACVSNEVGGNLVGNALWLGYPIRELLKKAGPQAGADMVLSRSSDGFTAGTPLDVLTDDGTEALLAVGMNGKPLPLEHGFPVRMVVPGLYGYVSATKWVVELTVTKFSKAIGYWTDKGWSERGPVKTASRIDTPKDGASIKTGTRAIAGVAWDQHTGIAKVEVRVDNGQWQQARLADAVSADTWRQWVLEWDAPKGSHTIEVRATNADGQTQTSAQAPPAPNGATGWHTITVTAA